MNRLLLLAACLSFTSIAFAADEPAAKADKFYLVETSDFDGSESVDTMGSADFKKLSDEIKQEERLFARALTLTEKEWKTGDLTKSKPFPRAGIKPRAVIVIDQGTKKVIDDKMAALDEKKSIRDRARADREAKRAKNNPPKPSTRNDGKGKDDREIMENRGLDLFKRNLETLKTEALQPKPAEKADAPKAEPAKAAEPPPKP